MDYKEKYEMALAKCKAYIDDTQKRWSEEFCKATEETFFEIFPELKESEDERIRKDIISYIKVANEILPQFQIDKWITWLEKQCKDSYFMTPEDSLGISSEKYNEIVDECIFGDDKKPQVDGFDAELNALLKKYEHLPKEEILECMNFYVDELEKQWRSNDTGRNKRSN